MSDREVEMSLPGALVISLDFELHWGVRDRVSAHGKYAESLLGARSVIPRFLELFEEFEIAATWATVGFLFARNRDELERFRPVIVPAYDDSRLNPYDERVGNAEADDPLHFAASLVERISRSPRQEIATHTFSHYLCCEPGQTVDTFRADIQAAVAIAEDRGIRLRSIVLPRNQFNESYASVLLENGITAYRGNPPSWMWDFETALQSRKWWMRLGRMADAFLPLGHHGLTLWNAVLRPTGLSNVAATQLFRPQIRWSLLRALHVHRLRRLVREAARSNKIVHLWWHPHNCGRAQDKSLGALRSILQEYADCRRAYGMISLNMSGVVEKVRPSHALPLSEERLSTPIGVTRRQELDPRDPFSTSRRAREVRVLTVTTVDITLSKLLMPLVCALRDQGFISDCASADGPDAQRLREAGFVVHPVPFRRKVVTVSHLKSIVRLYRLIRSRGYDVVHVHTPFAQVVGRIAARLAGAPIIIYTSHGFQFHESRARWARTAIIYVERILGRWTDMIFTQSKEDAETAAAIGIAPRHRIVWIGNGIQLERFLPGPADSSVLGEFGFSATNIVVGFTGRIVREKGVLELIEAIHEVATRVPDVRLLIVGDTLESDGDTDAKAVLSRSISDRGLSEVVRFAGFRDDVPRLLRAMDVFVLPSWREGMPRSIIEAMSVGLPVVATDIRGCREEVIHGDTGLLVPPRRVDLLASAILSLVTTPSLAQEMGAKGRERALEWFDEQKVVARQLIEYERLIERKGLTSNHAR